MSNLPVKKRRREPSTVVKDKFQAALLNFTAEFLKSRSFQHALTKGEEREKPLQKFFSDNLPKTYAVSHGEVVDLFDTHSPQFDLVVYDHLRNIAFYSGESVILPAEALLVSVEVKSLLTSDEIEKSVLAARQLKKLRPFKKPVVRAHRPNEDAGDECRYFHCLFAYSSNLSENNDWLREEYKRIARVIHDNGAELDDIDRIYVANRGLLNPSQNIGISEVRNDGAALLHFFTDVLNFLERENRRRKPVPYEGYAGRVGNLLEKLS